MRVEILPTDLPQNPLLSSSNIPIWLSGQLLPHAEQQSYSTKTYEYFEQRFVGDVLISNHDHH
jgi:hypothetical protein